MKTYWFNLTFVIDLPCLVLHFPHQWGLSSYEVLHFLGYKGFPTMTSMEIGKNFAVKPFIHQKEQSLIPKTFLCNSLISSLNIWSCKSTNYCVK